MRSTGLTLGLPVLIALMLGACASHPTRYYANDGPPEHVPPDLASVPDAVPRVEPVNPYANRPYSALGHSYTPDTSDAPFEQRGLASWYGRQYHGNRTASGEPYDMFAMSAAHPTLPIPSYARVTNVRDGRTVVVRINDRGPFLEDRIIDLSYAAAVRLGIATPGSGEVVVKKLTARDIDDAQKTTLALSRPSMLPPSSSAEDTALATTAQSEPLSAPEALAPTLPPILETSVVSEQIDPPAGAPAPPPPSGQAVAAAPALPDVPVTDGARPAPSSDGQFPGWSVQLGAFSIARNASALRDQIAQRLALPDADSLPLATRTVRIEQTGGLSRVLIGRLADRKSAQALALQLGKLLARETSLYGR